MEQVLEITKLVVDLERYHGTKLPESAMKDYVTILSTCEIDPLVRGVKGWKYQHGPTEKFPAPADLVKLYYEARNQVWERQKRDSPTLASAAERYRGGNKVLARKSFALMFRMLDKQITNLEAVEEMRKLDREFPGIGWDRAAEELKAWPEKLRIEREKYAPLRERIESMRAGLNWTE